jgi:hypothetical protein
MNNKSSKSIKHYIIVTIILIIALIVIIYLMKNVRSSKSAKPLTTESTTTLVDSSTNEVTSSSPFQASLSDVTYGHIFTGEFKEEITYNNTKFTFNCNTYDSETDTCTNGSGLMEYNNISIPIFTFTSSDTNYLNNPSDVYIDIENDYIFITTNIVGKSSGTTMVYTISGTLIGEINNVITGYTLNGRITNALYPNYNDSKFYFYYLDSNIIKVGYVEIDDLNYKIEDEIITGATLN